MELTKEHILKQLSDHLNELSKRYPIRSLALFGSYARGDNTTGSDIDILVDFAQPVGMEIVDLVLELESILDHKVDLVTYNAIKDRLFPFIVPDLMYVTPSTRLTA